MSVLVHLLMFAWIPLVVALFALLPPRRAAVSAFMFAWLFLPMAGYKIEGLPDYTKMSATCVGVLLATLVFDLDRFLSFRPFLLDVPMLLWCLCPLASALSNGFPLYHALGAVFKQTVTWGLPYLVFPQA